MPKVVHDDFIKALDKFPLIPIYGRARFCVNGLENHPWGYPLNYSENVDYMLACKEKGVIPYSEVELERDGHDSDFRPRPLRIRTEDFGSIVSYQSIFSAYIEGRGKPRHVIFHLPKSLLADGYQGDRHLFGSFLNTYLPFLLKRGYSLQELAFILAMRKIPKFLRKPKTEVDSRLIFKEGNLELLLGRALSNEDTLQIGKWHKDHFEKEEQLSKV